MGLGTSPLRSTPWTRPRSRPPSLAHEKVALAAYCELLKIAEGQSVLLEEHAREMIVAEELHLDEVNKMLRRPGDTAAFKG